jgi:hypothetical protein
MTTVRIFIFDRLLFSAFKVFLLTFFHLDDLDFKEELSLFHCFVKAVINWKFLVKWFLESFQQIEKIIFNPDNVTRNNNFLFSFVHSQVTTQKKKPYFF